MVKGHGKDNKNIKYENPCYKGCSHNRDKKRILWKDGIRKETKTLKKKYGKKRGLEDDKN